MKKNAKIKTAVFICFFILLSVYLYPYISQLSFKESIIIISGLCWLFGMNYIIFKSCQRRELKWDFLNPAILFKLQAIDWVIMVLLTSGLFYIIHLAFNLTTAKPF